MAHDTQHIRNVALFGHSGSGKTTFVETMLFEAGALDRRGSIDGQNTTSDYTNIEKERGNSLFSTLMHVEWKDSKINIIDTPGYDDFVGEVVSALKVADTAVLLLNAQNGVEVGTELIWEYVQKNGTPALFVINHLDSAKANYDNTLEQLSERFGSNVMPFQYPLETGPGFNTIVDALRMVMYVFPEGGGKPEKMDIPDMEIGRAQEMHNALVEAAAENDEELMDRFFEEGSLTEDELARGLTIALANQEIYPVFCASGLLNMGSGRIMGFLNDIAPSPADRPAAALSDGDELACDSSGDTNIFIYKTISEPQVGNVSYFKVYSGTLRTGDELENADNRGTERISQLFVSEGKERKQVNALKAGDIGVTVKLKNSHTNNTLNAKGVEQKIERIHFPQPRIRMAVVPPGKNDMEKMMKALHMIEEEDPTLKVEQNPVLHQTILHGQGQLHLDLIKYRIEKVYGVDMEFEEPRISYRETITKSADGFYRHKKQSGGAGQFAEVHMRIEPYTEGMPDPSDLSVRKREEEELPWGGKLSMLWCIVGGSIDAKYFNAVKKGVMQEMENGPLTGSPCANVRVCVYDGKMHSVDSNDMAFMLASAHAFRENFHKAAPMLMEPIYELQVLCAADVMGEVTGDLNTRRAIIQNMDSIGHYQRITAHVPLAELHQYSSSLRSMTHGKAKFSQKFHSYSKVPYEVQQKVVKENAGSF